jgi:hypothetical protein
MIIHLPVVATPSRHRPGRTLIYSPALDLARRHHALEVDISLANTSDNCADVIAE